MEFENIAMLRVGPQQMTPHFYLRVWVVNGHVAGLGSLARVWGRWRRWRRQKSWRLNGLLRNGLPHGPGRILSYEQANEEDQLP